MEIILSVGIFAVVLISVFSIFVSGIRSQIDIITLHSFQEEGSFLMERIVKEIRLASDNSSIIQSNSSNITFKNQEGKTVTYCRSDASGACQANGEYLARYSEVTELSEVISSSSIIINKLNFYFASDFTNIQPVVTVAMELKSNSALTSRSLLLQDSVALRIYD